MTPRINTVRAQFPRKFLHLLNNGPRYKGAWGGRGGLKSYAHADAALIRGAQQFERVLCARENMNSIKESVHHLLEARMAALGLQSVYEVLQSTILGPWFVDPRGNKRRTEFIFAGLRHNIDNIKSLEGATITWVEEAANVSKESWEKLFPTMRWEEPETGRAAEIWATWNSELETDDTHKRWILNPPPGAIVVYSSYLENPWLPEALRVEADYMKQHDPAGYRHVWMGECISEVEGAIFGDQLRQVDADGRLCSVPIDRTKPVDTYWDLGFGDTNAIWMMQAYGGWYNVVDYIEGNGLTIADWVVRLQQKGYVYGTDWLPHDGVDALLHKKLTGDRSKSVEMLMREAGRKPRVAPKLAVTDRINAARTVFSQCRFDAGRCADGVQALRHYQWGPVSALGVARREPLHDWASHACLTGDALVLTEDGPRQIDSIREGERVWTPRGYSEVTAAGPSWYTDRILTIKTTRGILRCTPEHKIFTSKGLKRADALRCSDKMVSGEEWNSVLSSWISTVTGFGYRETITGETAGISRARQTSIGPCGSMPTGPYLEVLRSITKTATRLTTRWRTWSACPASGINPSTHGSVSLLENSSPPPKLPSSALLSGTDLQKELSGTGPTARAHGRTANGLRRFALYVVSRFSRLILRLPNSATSVVEIAQSGYGADFQLVYDLTVKNHGCYQANGLLVSNSDAFCCLAVAAKHPPRQETAKRPPPRPVSAWA